MPAAEVISPFSRLIVAPPGAPALYAPERVRAWSHAFDLWLDSRTSPNTRRAYRLAWDSFLAHTHKHPSEITRADVAGWLEHLRAGGLSPETIHQRLAALSSFYTFAGSLLADQLSQSDYLPMTLSNPVTAVPRPRRSPYGKARYLSADEARALLCAIPRHTLQGKRDYALFLAYLATGRRNSEVRQLRWGDIETDGERVFYRWHGKGKHRRDECPLHIWQAIRNYLSSAGQLAAIQPQDYLFTALNDHASRLPHIQIREIRDPNPLTAPLSTAMVNRLLKKYCRLAGLDPDRVTVHTLRHTAAMLRKQVGDDVEQISAFLAHSSLAVTQIYLHSVEGQTDTSWVRVASLLGL